jgi:hypothetical protein
MCALLVVEVTLFQRGLGVRRLGVVSSLRLIVLMLVSINAVTIRAQAVTSVPNMISVVTGTDGALYWNGFYNGTWGGWQPLSGGSPSPPALCQSGSGPVELVVEGYDENIYYKSFSAGSWSPTWGKVPTGATDEQPTCAVLGSTMSVVVRGTDTNLWANSLDLNTGTWSAWVNLGGSSPSPPALAASPSIGALDLVVRGTDNIVYHKFYANGGWSTLWDDCGSGSFLRASSAPAIISGNRTGTNLVRAVVLGTDGFYSSLTEYAGQSWNGPGTNCIGWGHLFGIPFGFLGPPTLVVDEFGPPNPDGNVYAIVRGGDSHVHLAVGSFSLTNSFSSWYDAGGNTGNRPAAALVTSGTVGVVVSGASGGIWYNSFICCGSWSGWTAINGATSIDPGMIAVP